ncbi:hypothetical protein BDR26DRAFT_871022 [Obelidium mucronatum]|nr:hypothetical protein BDR26DRAFT_871022 [Obelidium mucronatum]
MNIGSSPHIQSGSVVVFAENNQFSQMLRFRDGRRWSPSRPQGPFLLYREVEAVTQQRRLKEASTRFTNVALRVNSQFVSNGLAKRTLRVLGSDGLKYRVISYFYPTDVEHLFQEGKTGRLILPSNSQEFKPFISKLEGLELVGRPDAFPAPSSSSNGSETSTKRKRFRNSPDDSYTPVLTRSRLKSAAISEAVKAKSPALESLNSIIERNAIITQSVLEGNFGNHAIFQVNRPIPPQCPCGGLGVRKAADYFRGEKEAWTGKSVWLAPLNH